MGMKDKAITISYFFIVKLKKQKNIMNLEVWGQVDEKYNVLVRPYRNFTPIKFIDCVEFSALLLVEMTLAKNWFAK